MFDTLAKGFSQLAADTRNLFGRFGRKSVTFRSFMRQLNVKPSFTNADFREFTEEAFQKNPYVYSVITQVANSAAAVPPKLYRVKDNGRVANAIGQYDRKRHADRLQRRKLRSAAKRVQRTAARRHSMRTGAPMAVSKAFATKALVTSGELEPIEGHELLDLLHNPNDVYQTSYQQFMQAMVMHLEIGGETFMEPIKASGRPRELYVLPPRDVRIKKGDARFPIEAFVFGGGGSPRTLNYAAEPDKTEVFYSRYYNPLNPLRGLSPAQAAAYSVDVNNEGREWNLKLLQNGAALSGVISAKSPLSPEQVEKVREKFNRKYAGSSNAGKIAALDGVEGLDFTPMSQTVKDMQWGALNQMSAMECAIVWNTPPEIIGHDESKTFANYEEARRAFYLEKILPLLDFTYGELNSSVVPLYGDDLWLDYNTEEIDALADDVNELHERIREDVKVGLLTINEGRAEMGYDEVDGGDVILTDVRQVPLETAIQSQQAPSAGGGGGSSSDDDEEEEEEESAYPAVSTIRARTLASMNGNGHA